MSGRIYREATFYAQRQDEFTGDAGVFGIEVPSTYGCISGCKACRDFRNEVRAARERFDSAFAAVEPFVFAASEPPKVESSLDVTTLDAMERIVAATNLSNVTFATIPLNERRNSLIAELLG